MRFKINHQRPLLCVLTLFYRMVCQLALRTFHTVKHGEIIRNFWKDLYLITPRGHPPLAVSVPRGSPVVEGAQLPGGQLAHFWEQRHEGYIPTGTSVSAATQNTLFQMDDLCHQQHEIIPSGIGLRSRNNKTTINYSDVNVTVLIDRKPTFIICQSSARF